MAVRVQRIRNRPMAACTKYSGDDLDTKAIHPAQWKMTKRKRTGNKPMAVDTQHVDFGPRVETNFYLKRAQQMGKSLIIVNTQWIDSSLMVVSQLTTMPRVVAKQ